MPRMAFIGVRSSWLMLARNWLLATLAASAAALAWTRASSARLRSVMSAETPMVEIIRPSVWRTGTSTSVIRLPSGVSTVSQYLPVAVRSIFCKDSARVHGKMISRILLH